MGGGGGGRKLSGCQHGSLRRARFQAFVLPFIYWRLELVGGPVRAGGGCLP